MKRVVIVLLIGLLIAGGAVYFIYNKPHRDVTAEEPAHRVTANQLFDDYEADEAAANAKYLDKTIEVTGTVSEITVNDAGQTSAILTAENAMIGGVSTTFQTAITMEPLKEGQEVCVKGRCTGKLMDVVVTDCTLKVPE
jgi:archaellum component FlaF (FlaF/FlaG flagellin family)